MQQLSFASVLRVGGLSLVT